MTSPPEQPRFNPSQYGYRPDQPPQQRPAPQQWQQAGPQQTGPQPAVPPQGEPGAPPVPPGPAGPPPVRRKGFFGSLLDTKFDAMVTPMLIRGFYLLSLFVVTIDSIFLHWLIWVATGSSAYGEDRPWSFWLALAIALPVWLFQIVTVRVALEFVINQFKITEELQKIRRNTGQQ